MVDLSKPRILLVQLFSNGDCLYATAVARQIKQDYKHCHLTWAVSASCEALLQNNPFVDELLVVSSVSKNDERSFRRFLKEVQADKSWNKVVVTHIMAANQANYDGCIRSTIMRGYRYPLSVDISPVLHLNDEERERIKQFCTDKRTSLYKNVILFEFAPQSGQAVISLEDALQIAERLIAIPQTAVILSSAHKITHPDPAVIDGSELSLRETAGLTHYCTLLLGCSSGITWISTSSAARRLPMIQILDPEVKWANPVSRDFKRFGIDDTFLIELLEFQKEKVIECIRLALTDFSASKVQYHQTFPINFRTTRSIVYNLLCYREFKAISRHIRINREVFGYRRTFYKEVLVGFLIFPFRLVRNFIYKRLL